MPVAYAAEWPSRAASRGPPAWIVLGLLLALIIVVIVVTLAVDGVFNAAPGELLSPPLTWAALPRWA